MTTNSPFPWLATADPTPPRTGRGGLVSSGRRVTAEQLGGADGWPPEGLPPGWGPPAPAGRPAAVDDTCERARCRRAHHQRRMAPAERGADAPPRRRPRRAGRSRRHRHGRRQAGSASGRRPGQPRRPAGRPASGAVASSSAGGRTRTRRVGAWRSDRARPSSAQPPGPGRARQPHRRPVAGPRARRHDRAPSPTGATAPRGRPARPRRIPGHGRGRPRAFRGRRLQRPGARGPDEAGTRRAGRQQDRRRRASPPGSPRTSSAGTRTHPRSAPRRCARTPATPTAAGTPPRRVGTAGVANVSTSSFRRRRCCAWRRASSWCH